MKRLFSVACLLGFVILLAATERAQAQYGVVYGVPAYTTTVYPAPVYAPAYVASAPAYYSAAPLVYTPPTVYAAPAPIVYGPRVHVHGHWGYYHGHVHYRW